MVICETKSHLGDTTDLALVGVGRCGRASPEAALAGGGVRRSGCVATAGLAGGGGRGGTFEILILQIET